MAAVVPAPAAVAPPRFLAAVQAPGFAALALAFALMMAAGRGWQVTANELVFQISGSYTAVGLVSAITAGEAFWLAIPLGLLADRLPRRALLAFGCLGSGLCAGLALLFTTGTDVAPLFGVSAGISLGRLVAFAALFPLLFDRVPRRDALSAALWIAIFGAPALALFTPVMAAILDLTTTGIAVLCIVLLSFLASALGWLGASAPRPRVEEADGHRDWAPIILSLAVAGVIAAAGLSVSQIALVDGSEAFAAIVAASGLLAPLWLVLLWFAGRGREGVTFLAVSAAVAGALVLAGLAFLAGFVGLGGFLALTTQAVLQPLRLALIALVAPVGSRGLAFGLSTATMSLTGVGTAVLHAIADASETGIAVTFAGLVLAIFVVILWLIPAIRGQSSTPHPAA